MDLLQSLAIKTLLYAVYVQSFSCLLIDKTGFWPVGHLAIFAVGALVYAALTVAVGFSGGLMYAAIVLAGVAAAALSLIPAMATVKVRGHFFIFVSIALNEVVRVLIQVVAGPGGYSSVPRPQGLASTWGQGLVVLAFYLVTTRVCERIGTHRVNDIAKISKANETAASLLGIRTQRLRIDLFVLSGAIAGVAGALFAGFTGGTDPVRFSVAQGVIVFALALLVGTDFVVGPILAGGVYVMLTFVLETGLRDVLPRDATMVATLLFGLVIILASRTTTLRVTDDLDET